MAIYQFDIRFPKSFVSSLPLTDCFRRRMALKSPVIEGAGIVLTNDSEKTNFGAIDYRSTGNLEIYCVD